MSDNLPSSKQEMYHVIMLTPDQQYSLKLLMQNLYCHFLADSIKKVLDKGDETTAVHNTHMAILYFRKYNELNDLLATEDQVRTADSKILTIQPSMMKSLVKASESYDKDNCYLNSDDIRWVEIHISELRSKIQESYQFTFSMVEIHNEKKRSGM